MSLQFKEISLQTYLSNKAEHYFIKGNEYREAGEYKPALTEFQQALDIFSEAKDHLQVINCLDQLSSIYRKIGSYGEALDKQLQLLKVVKELDDTKGEYESLNKVGDIYQVTEEFKPAGIYFLNALKIAEKLKDQKLIISSNFRLGNCYNWDEKLKEAEEFLVKSVKLAEELNNPESQLKPYASLAILYTKLKRYDEALEWFLKAIAIAEKLNDIHTKTGILKSLGNLYFFLKEYDKAINTLQEAIMLSTQLDLKGVLMLSNHFISESYSATGHHDKALEHYKKYHELKDSLRDSEINLKMKGIQVRYDVEEAKKESEIFRLKNIDLAEANEKIGKQKNEIEQKNTEITSSIVYARRIQQAILPKEKKINEHLREFFILYLPKDIVSGDFYWFDYINGSLIIAAGDCTGHGVPGALMSMVGSNLLNQVSHDKSITSPAFALLDLDKKVRNAFDTNELVIDFNDGMDMAICAIDTIKNNFNFSGANRPLIQIRGGEVIQYKGDKFAIGDRHRPDKQFTNHNIPSEKQDCFYMFTDGFADQFGGPAGKKFKYKNLLKLLSDNSHLPMSEQKENLEAAFKSWKGNIEQVDDVLVIGFRL